jgi:hypothetical protein
MNATEFYNNGIGEDIEQVHKNITIELMENYAKHYHECKVKNLHLQNVSNSLLPCGFDKCVIDIKGEKMCDFCKYKKQ